MCLITLCSNGESIPRDIFMYAAKQNNDGIGIMSIRGVEKFMGRKSARRAYRLAQALSADGVGYAVHMRWATHGSVCRLNTHPFRTGNGKYVMHNGIISQATAKADLWNTSDTAVYVHEMLFDAPEFTDLAHYDMIAEDIGWGNKLVIMDEKGEFMVCNHDAGTEIGGIWYSNTYSLPDSALPPKSSVGWYNPNGDASRYDDKYLAGYDRVEWGTPSIDRYDAAMRKGSPAEASATVFEDAKEFDDYYRELEGTIDEDSMYFDNGTKSWKFYEDDPDDETYDPDPIGTDMTKEEYKEFVASMAKQMLA